MRSKIILLCLLMSMSMHNYAQTLSLQQAVTLTLQHYPTLKVKQTLTQAAAAHTTDVNHEWYPSAKVMEQLSAGTDNGIYGSYFPMSTIPSTSGGIRDGNRSDLMSGNISLAAVQWEVYNFGAYKSRRAEAHQQELVANADAGVTANDLTISVIADYLGMLEYYSLMRIQQDNIRRTHEVQLAVTSIVLHGLKPGVDSSIAAAEMSKARLNLLDMQNGYNQLRTHLALLTGLDSAAIKPDTLYTAGLLDLLKNATDTATIQPQHPALQYYQALVGQELQHEQVLKRNTLPKIYLQAFGWLRGSSGEYNDYFNKDLWSGLGYSRYNYLGAITLSYNLADIWHTRDKVREQKFRIDAARQNLDASHTMLDEQLTRAQVNIRTDLDKLNEMPFQLNAARAAAAQKVALYKGGLTTIIEVTNALYVLNRAETDLVQTNHNAWEALFMQAFASNHTTDLVQQLELSKQSSK
jgi:outer membrane protein, adhesin transport system